jgi:hypothetical protein
MDHIDVAVDTGIHVRSERAGEAADLCIQPKTFDGGDDLAFGLRRSGKTCFDGMDADTGEVLCNIEFLFARE